MSDDEYNGWTNWETWNVNVWLSNEEECWKNALAASLLPDLEATERLKYLTLHHTRAVTGDGVTMSKVNWSEILEGLRDA